MKDYFVFAMIIFSYSWLSAQENFILTFSVTTVGVSKDQFKEQGRIFVFLSENKQGKPRNQLWPVGTQRNHIYAKTLTWPYQTVLEITSDLQLDKTARFDLHEIPAGDYSLQVLWDQDRAESRINAPGNLYSKSKMVTIDKNTNLQVQLTEIIPARSLVKHELVEKVVIESKLLSAFWNQPVNVAASILLPASYHQETDTRYPVRYNVAGYGGRYTRVNNLVRNKKFMDWWTSSEAPQIINVFLDGEGPYGDSYQLDSENNGPFGKSLTEELIPHIENTYRGTKSGSTRFVDGCSTGGWVSLALQLFYPDHFNGVWSYSPDAIEFENYQTINIYKDDNAFYNEWGNQRPVARDIAGDPIVTMKDFIQYENVLGTTGTYVTSGGQFSAHTALYSPRGKNGLPAPLFDPWSGAIDATIAEAWKKYDLKIHLQKNWTELGPKLQGKIYIWMGDMDDFILNPATRKVAQFLEKTQNPTSDAVVKFSPMQGHCWQFDHIEILKMMGQK